ncbi:MAG: ABC transporter ATP-binding protein [Gemmatimonadales bacterium]|nr:MAG: ABC transporter ATP-binding protein [Gemmatimonadales bacterium]
MSRSHASQADERKKRKLHLATVRREARDLIWRYRRTLGVGFSLMLVNRAAGFVLPASSKFLIDDVLGEGRGDLLIPLAVAVGVATLFQAASAFGLSQVVSVAGQRAIADMRRKVQAHVLRMPTSYFDRTKSGILLARVMEDADGIRNLIGTGIIQLVGGLLTATAALVILFWLNWQMTAGALVLLLGFSGIMFYAFRRLRPIFRERYELTSQVTGRLSEALGGVRTLKVYTAERREARVFTKGVFRLFRNIASTITGTSAVTAASTVIVGAIGVLIMIMGGQAILAETMTLGELVMYIFFVGLMVSPLVQIAGIGTQITDAFAGLDRIRELLALPTERDDDATRQSAGELRGEVAFESVTFSYEPGVPVLKEVSFHAPAGTTTALVGPSGSGKSTMISLVLAFGKPDSGRVLVDGQDLAQLRLGDYRAQLGVVLQDNFLFDGTIRENIGFSRPGASDEEIRHAARVANAAEFVEGFEAGYETIVGERGVKLSGGQRQRIAIARAILADPRILVLDEATSSLDSESEALIRDGLHALRKGRTTFVIAHRLSTIVSADQILVLDEGQIVERGPHSELRWAGGLYQRLYEMQHRVEMDAFVNPGEEFPDPDAEPGEEGVRVRVPSRQRL